ncbi:conserved hypothetical protein [Roseibium sp. TrichSKD4]|nr:conserved hypothetical protein [Roseibium sp. TrichSKD4]
MFGLTMARLTPWCVPPQGKGAIVRANKTKFKWFHLWKSVTSGMLGHLLQAICVEILE